ncbi:MAG: hypothetical protein AAGF50_10905 [Pseudomonadota bacterium]
MAIPTLVDAQISGVTCDDRARLIKTLETVIGVERPAVGLRDPETTLEVWVAARNGN